MRLPFRGSTTLFLVLLAASVIYAEVSKEIEVQYRQKYANKAMFLKVPVRGDRQTVHVLEGGSSLDQTNLGQPLQFKVGEQVRITDVRFKDSEVEFKVSSIDMSRKGTLIFQFRNPLRHSFVSRGSFDAALSNSFTEGLSYQEIDSAKEGFIQDQFDTLLRQFAVTTDTSVEFVLDAITARNSRYQEVVRKLDEASRQVAELTADLDEERGRSRSRQSDAERAARSLAEVNETNKALRAERDRIVKASRDLEKKFRSLEEENRRFRVQVEEVARKLDIQNNSSAQLGQQVASLSSVIDSLKQEKVDLSKSVETLTGKVDTLSKEKTALTSELSGVKKKNRSLRSDLDALTSDKDQLAATYLQVKRNKENMERAKGLESALRVERSVEEREDGIYQVSQLYLLSQKIGEFEIQTPLYLNEEFSVSFRAASPDRVEFTEEEREFYESLGDTLKVEPTWVPGSNRVETVLQSGTAVQEVAPRDQGEWTFLFQGDIDDAEQVKLGLRLIDVDDQVVEMASQDYELNPAGFFARLLGSFSWASMLIGLGLGVIGGAFVGSMRGGLQGRKDRSAREREFAAQKQL